MHLNKSNGTADAYTGSFWFALANRDPLLPLLQLQAIKINFLPFRRTLLLRRNTQYVAFVRWKSFKKSSGDRRNYVPKRFVTRAKTFVTPYFSKLLRTTTY